MLRRIVMAVVLSGLLAAGTMSGARAQQPISAGQPAANPSGWIFNVVAVRVVRDHQHEPELQPAARARAAQCPLIPRSDSATCCPT